MNIVMSSDNAYAPYLSVALLSFTNSNKKDYFKIFVIDGGISNKNKRKIRSFVVKFGHSINFVGIDLERFKTLVLSMMKLHILLCQLILGFRWSLCL